MDKRKVEISYPYIPLFYDILDNDMYFDSHHPTCHKNEYYAFGEQYLVFFFLSSFRTTKCSFIGIVRNGINLFHAKIKTIDRVISKRNK